MISTFDSNISDKEISAWRQNGYPWFHSFRKMTFLAGVQMPVRSMEPVGI
jgi:hypothetical protein